MDEACLPIRFSWTCFSLKDKSDIIVIPRIMQVKKENIYVQKFCGLPEMIINSIPDIPKTITEPIYAISKRNFIIGQKMQGNITKDKSRIKRHLVWL